MFLKTKTLKSTTDYWSAIKHLKKALDTSDAVLIGAGAGLSTSAGLEYGGQRFYENFYDYVRKYNLQDMYSAGFYPYDTLEEYWAYWSRHIYLNRYKQTPNEPYTTLLKIVKSKNYFILTTNVDHSFQKVGFDKKRLFYTQGDYGLWQCSKPCCQETYDNEKQVMNMLEQQRNMKIPASLIPYCSHCGSPMTMNLRIDETFVEDKGWHLAHTQYKDFINANSNKKILYLELGVGYNTPAIIKYPFWKMTLKNNNAIYACVNFEDCAVPQEIKKQSILIQEDIKAVISDLYSLYKIK